MPNPFVEDARHYLETHGGNILQAMQIAKRHAVKLLPDQDDKSYWDHEIKALRKAVAKEGLPALPETALNVD